MSQVRHQRPPKPEPIIRATDAAYRPFEGLDDSFYVMAPTIANARAYAAMLVRASATSTIDKQRICDQWGWDLKAIGEEPAIAYEAYQRRRCELLFGEGISPYLQEHFEALNNDEVARAHANFINRSQIAIRLPQPSLNELADALQRAVSTKT